MKRVFKPLGLAPLVALLALGSGVWLYAQISRSHVHPLDSACESCHLAGANTTPSNASVLIANQEQLCSQCHSDALQMSHPSGFTPPHGQKIPAGYPLDWKGDLTCSTCHDVHSDLPGKLRGAADGRDFCIACHEQSFFDKMRDGGASIMQSGHLGAVNARNWQTLDQYSIQCLECHSDNGDVDDSAPIVFASYQIVRHGSVNHPIGRSYAAAERHGGYKPMAFLSKKIRLPNGMVSCISCHEGYSKTHGKAVMSNTGSKLCFECHDL